MNEWFIDSFYFLAIPNPRDHAHAKAAARVNQIAKVRLVTTAWVLTEVADAFAAPRYRPTFSRIRTMLAKRKAVVLGPNAELFEKGIDLYQRRPDKEWSLTDCISFVTMTERGISTALTGDQHFTQAGFTALLA